MSGPGFIRKYRGKPFRPAKKKGQPSSAGKVEKQKGKPAKRDKKPRRLGPQTLARLRTIEREIIALRRKNHSVEAIDRELKAKGKKFSPASIRLFLNLLVEEGKLKAFKAVSPTAPVGPNEATRKKLGPHRQYLLESFGKGMSAKAILKALGKKGVNVSPPTLRNYLAWLRARKG